MTVIVVGAVVGAIALWFILTFNSFVRLRHLAAESWSGMDVQLKRRHDLIPSIVSSVKGYAAHERQLIDSVTSLRSCAGSASSPSERGRTENELSAGLKALLAVAEAYPDLKASGNFLKLQETLTHVEDEIQMARRYYNGTVRNLNILVESFPSNLIARAFGFKSAEFFEIDLVTQRQTPDVKL